MESKEKRFEEAPGNAGKREIKIKYSNDEITVVWQPNLCIHSGICFTGLPKVFNPLLRKWVRPYNAPSDEIIEQVKKCPSGALSFYVNEKKED